jgi:murein DD-endopeptidase MepM/ murein hydrolase activator NlpD
VVPSALRTMSVVTLLSAVSGTVALMNHHHQESVATAPATSGSLDLAGGGRSTSFALALSLRAAPIDRAADQRQRRIEARAQQSAATEAAQKKIAAAAEKADRERARARRVAADKAEAAADRRREAIRQRASRSASRDPQQLARVMVADRGWGSGQFGCLQSLWNRESGWNYRASNPSSGAYGIPQALPGSKMASAGADWRTNPVTQMTWGLDYIADRYGTPCGAWGHSESSGWY